MRRGPRRGGRAPVSLATRLASGVLRRPAVVLLVAVTAAYATALPNGFVYDDLDWIVLRPRVRALGDVLHVVVTPEPVNPVFADVRGTVYRAGLVLAVAIGRALWGTRAWAFHAAVVGLHAANAVLFAALLRRLGVGRRVALAAAVLWALHPALTEAVAWISGGVAPLGTAFLLLALHATMRVTEAYRRGAGWAAAAACAVSLGLLAHEFVVVAPALAVLVLGWLRARGALAGASPRRVAGAVASLAIPVGLYLVLRFTLAPPTAGSPGIGSAAQRALGIPVLATRYLALLAFPATLSLERSSTVHLPSDLADAGLWTALAVLAGLGLLLGRGLRRPGRSAWALAAFGIAFLPFSNLIPLYSVFAERYLYLPAMGAALATACVGSEAMARLRKAYGRGAAAWAGGVALGLLLAGFSARTAVRNLDWRDNLTLFRATVRATPTSAAMRSNLGAELLRAGALAEAEGHLSEAVRLRPEFAEAHNNLGMVHLERGDLSAAIAAFRRATTLKPDDAEARTNLGEAHLRAGEVGQARVALEAALRVRPDLFEAHLLLGDTLLAAGDPARAAEAYERALALRPAEPAIRAKLEAARLKTR